jgi:phage FluMu protein Com
MALFRCNKCSHIREVTNDYIGKSVKCPRCKEVTPIHDTLAFIENLMKNYQNQNKELKHQHKMNTDTDLQVADQQAVEEIDIYNTTALTKHDQYKPIVQWFQKQQIQVHVDHEANDTTGFFDEIALSLGNNYDILKEVSNQIKYVQQKGYTNVKLQISNKSQKKIDLIKKFCEELYEYSFLAKYFYKKKEQTIHLTLHTTPKITNFFNGIWMEWFVLMKLLEFFREKQITPSLLRSIKVTFPNEDSNELDIFFLTENQEPVCIECKSGEYRPYIDKYLKLQKRLKIDKAHFILCVIGLSLKQTQGLTSTYGLTFVNEKNFLKHIEQILIPN